MPDCPPPVALCCYKNRAVVAARCDLCRPGYACPEFKSKEALLKFNAMIPATMLLAPLPIELWPAVAAAVEPDSCSRTTPHASAGEPAESPVRLFVSTLIGGDPQTM